MTIPCEQAQRIERIEGRLGRIETAQAVASERWDTVVASLGRLGERMDAHAKGSEKRAADLQDRLLDEISGRRKAGDATRLKIIGVIGTVAAALAGAGGLGWWSGASAASATQDLPSVEVQVDGVAEVAP